MKNDSYIKPVRRFKPSPRNSVAIPMAAAGILSFVIATYDANADPANMELAPVGGIITTGTGTATGSTTVADIPINPELTEFYRGPVIDTAINIGERFKPT